MREDGAYIANTRFTDMSGETKHLLVYILFVREYMCFHGEPSQSNQSISPSLLKRIKEVKDTLLLEYNSHLLKEDHEIAKFNITSSKSVNAQFDSGRSTNEVCLSSGFLGKVNYSLEMKYPFFMDIMNPQNSGPRNVKIISDASINFFSF